MPHDFDPKDELEKPPTETSTEPEREEPDLDDDHPRIEFVVLCEAQGEINTRLLKAALDDIGMPTVLAGDALDTVHIYPARDSKILVPRRRYLEAKRIMDIVLSPSEDAEVERQALAAETRCEACGALVPDNATKCPDCGEPFE